MRALPTISYEGIVTAWKVNGRTPHENIVELRQVIEAGAILPEKYNVAVIDYDVQNCQPNEFSDMNHYPLKFGSFHGAPWVFISATGGVIKRSCSNGILECLKLMGFELTHEEESLILSLQSGEKKPRLSFYK